MIQEKIIIGPETIIKGLTIRQKDLEQLRQLPVDYSGGQDRDSVNLKMMQTVLDNAIGWVQYTSKGSMYRSTYVIVKINNRLFAENRFFDITEENTFSKFPQIIVR